MSVTTKYLVAVLVVASLLAAVPAAASPGQFGLSGLVRTPHADTLQPQEFNFGGYLASDFENVFSMNVGVFPNIELSAAYVDPHRGNSAAIISGKWRIFSEAEQGFALAAGVWDISSEYEHTLFGVIQKHFTVGNTPVRATAGLASNSVIAGNFFAGAEAHLGRDWSLILEWDGDNANGALRFPLVPNLELTAGVLRNELFAGATWTIH